MCFEEHNIEYDVTCDSEVIHMNSHTQFRPPPLPAKHLSCPTTALPAAVLKSYSSQENGPRTLQSISISSFILQNYYLHQLDDIHNSFSKGGGPCHLAAGL